MKNWILKMLASFDYHSISAFFESVAPSFRYTITRPLVFLSAIYAPTAAITSYFFPAVETTLGIQGGAFVALIVAFVTELVTGIVASHIRAEQFSSLKLSRFTLKVFIYLVLIGVPYHWAQNFKTHQDTFMSGVFDWLQNFLIAQIVFENFISILENMAVISGKDKTAWINKIKDKLTALWP